MNTLKELHDKLLKYSGRKSFDIEIDYISEPSLEGKILSIDKLSHGESYIRIHNGNDPLQAGDWFYRTYIKVTVLGEHTGRWGGRGVAIDLKLLVTGDSLETYHQSLQQVSDELECKGDLYWKIVTFAKDSCSDYDRSNMAFILSGEPKPLQNEPHTQ